MCYMKIIFINEYNPYDEYFNKSQDYKRESVSIKLRY